MPCLPAASIFTLERPIFPGACALPVSGSKFMKKPRPRSGAQDVSTFQKVALVMVVVVGGVYRDINPPTPHPRVYLWKGGCTPRPIPHPCPSPTARPLWIYFANKEKNESLTRAVSGRLLALFCFQLFTVWFYSMQILPVI